METGQDVGIKIDEFDSTYQEIKDIYDEIVGLQYTVNNTFLFTEEGMVSQGPVAAKMQRLHQYYNKTIDGMKAIIWGSMMYLQDLKEDLLEADSQ